MNASPIVLLLGESLFSESIAQGLANRLKMNVVRMDPGLLEMKDCLKCLQPNLIIFNLGDPWSDRLVDLLNEWKEIKLAGLDATNYHLILLTSHDYVSPTIEELMSANELGS
jgi:hypothetical protein